jgi:excisionase family DNA binding protein
MTMELIKVGEAARLLGVHADTVRRLTAAGKLPAVILPSKHRRYQRSVVERLRQSWGYQAEEAQ